jgi:branched-chain amino acid transport system permease protein
MGLSAFIVARLTKNFGVNHIWAILLSVGIICLLSFAIGRVIVRLTGTFFAFSTIAIVQITSTCLTNYRPLTNGQDGITGIPKLTLFTFQFNSVYRWFYLMCIITLTCALIVERIRRSVLGRSLAAIRDNEIAAQTLGVNIFRTRLAAFIISNIFAALSGCLLAFNNSAVSPMLFTFATEVNFYLMLMLGGVDSTFGTFVGTLLVTHLPEWLRPLSQYLRLIYGVSVIILMTFMPMGLAGMVNSLIKKIRRMKRSGWIAGVAKEE